MYTASHRSLISSLTAAQEEKRLSLDKPGGRTPETWFLGPKGENAEFLKRLVTKAIEHNVDARRDYMPGDPPIFDEARGRELGPSEAFITRQLDHMLHYLRGSVPLSSHRNLSHMYWDQSLPAVVGYISALLYNQNNVAAEASPATTLFEIEVGNDLCRMLGYPLPTTEQVVNGAIKPWGHITCDGSVANAESVWAARNTKYAAVAFAEALRAEPDLAAARNTTVLLLDGHRARLLDLDPWRLLNLPIDVVLELAPRLSKVGGVDPSVVEAALGRHSVQALGLVEFHRRFLPDIPPPVTFAPQTAHYSWPKAMALLGLGRSALRTVPVDGDGRMDMVALRAMLDRCLDERQPVMQVTAVLGSTEESAVDPLAEILRIRDEYRAFGLEFSVHADAAWGGYFASLLRAPRAHDPSEPQDTDLTDATLTERDPWHALMLGEGARAPGMMFSDYVMRQFLALPQANSITVDPHKAGFIPYPAGALCYRNGASRDLVSFKVPVVYHGGIDPTVGVYGIEGSKPGAAAAAAYLSHRVIRTDRSGYGELLSRCIFNAKRFYSALVGLDGDDFAVTTFQRLPAEKVKGATFADIAAQKEVIAHHIAPLDDADLVGALMDDANLFALFRDLGPDLTITTYAFNFKTAAGLNTDAALMNEMNDLMYRRLSLQAFNGGMVTTTPMFVTSSSFDPAGYGQDFVTAFAQRAGVVPQPGLPMSFLISTTQNPWLSESGSSLQVLRTLMQVLGDTATGAAQDVRARHGIDPPT